MLRLSNERAAMVKIKEAIKTNGSEIRRNAGRHGAMHGI
jgi:hypothetical protein